MSPVLQNDLGQTCIVEASAGTGKTRELVERIVQVLSSGVPVDGIVAVTFTDVAAGHLKLRLRERLDAAREQAVDDTVHQHLALALQRLDRAYVGTFHAFCAQLLHQRPVEAGIDPAFEELPDPQRLFASVFRSWLDRKLAQRCPALRRAFERLMDSEREPVSALRNAAWQLVEWRDYPTPWQRPFYDRQLELDGVLEKARGLLQLRSRCSRAPYDELFRSLQPVEDLLARLDRSTEVGLRDDDRIEAEVLRLPRDVWLKPGQGKYADGLPRETVVAAWEDFKQAIEIFRLRANADLVSALRDELWSVVEAYEEAKQRAGKLDFADLLIKARDLLGRHDSVRRYFQARYTHIFVDEFQDTDPVQFELLQLLSSDEAEKLPLAPGKLFAVGDPKQSIYRFRRADVDLYRRVCTEAVAAGAVQCSLQWSRRSVESIQNFVNSAFAEMPGYLPLHGGARSPLAQPALVALPMPEPYQDFPERVTKKAINACAPHTVAAFVDWLLHQSHWSVRERPDSDERRALRSEDICILFRRFTNFGDDLSQTYVRALEARGIRHVLVGSKSFHRREEIGTLRTGLRAIEWLDDELSTFAVLRGGLFAIGDGTLLKFRLQFGRFYAFMEFPEDLDPEFAPIKDAFTLLLKLHRRRNQQPIVDTLNQLLEHVRAHAGFAFRKGGERVLANVYRLADMARSFEATSATSFRSFVEYLEDEYVSSEASEATVLEHSAEGVKLMTVHKAKGLEFPVVILADMCCNLAAPSGPDRFVDPERRLCAQKLLGWAPWELLDRHVYQREEQADLEEARRIAYVAATRARDLLVVSALGEEEWTESWLSPLYPALYPKKSAYRESQTAAGCPSFGHSTVSNRPASFRGEEPSIRPGLHTSRVGLNKVVWFDPEVLRRKVDEPDGLAHEDLLRGSAQERQAGRTRYEGWSELRKERNRIASEPSARILQVTNSDAAIDTEPVPVEIIRVGSSTVVTRAFGKLVHAILQRSSWNASREQLLAIAQIQSRLPGQGAPDLDAAVAVVEAALAHPVLRAAAQAQPCHREYPVAMRLPNNRLVEGVVDLAYFDGEIWTVIDFKTGSANQSRYRHQVSLYATALSRATGQPARAFLLAL